MKVTKLIELEPMEVDVSITVEDITCALNEEADTPAAAFRLLNQVARCMKAITDEIIDKMNVEQLETIAKFLEAQADRYHLPDLE